MPFWEMKENNIKNIFNITRNKFCFMDMLLFLINALLHEKHKHNFFPTFLLPIKMFVNAY